MASTYNVDYNPYSDIQKVYNAKVGWNNAKTDEERQNYNTIATAARKQLEAYGYGDIVKQISADGADATATRKIMEQYAPKTTTNTITKVPVETNNLNSAEVNRENAGLFDKYNQSYDDLTKTNPFTTDEAKAILAKYDLAGLQGRDNAVASGSATNGGNIDSYAAANAMRQQASLVNQGHMTVLDAHQQKIDNVRGLLSDMGVNIDRVFNQDETAKNNDVARKSEIASVTGYTPTEWTYDNNIYLNKDGTVRDEYLTDEFDNTGGFTTIINDAKAKLATTTDPTERANLQATINAATQAKALKTFSSPKYSKYAHEVQGTKPQQTEAGRQFDEQNAAAREALGIEVDLSKYGIDAEKEIAKANNQNALDQITLQALYSQASTGQLTDEAKKQTAASINNTYKDVVSGDLITQVGGKYVINGGYGGAVARYLMSAMGDPDAVADLMYQMFGTPKADTQVALNKPKVYDWEVDYNPANYN
jgi:hypothetical protein